MIGPPPDTDDIRELREWCHKLYNWILYPDKMEVQFVEFKTLSADPDTPGAERIRLYAKKNTYDQTALFAMFSSGPPADEVSTQPS